MYNITQYFQYCYAFIYSMNTAIIKSLDNYMEFARKIYDNIERKNTILFLNGPMGIGKTTFARTLLRLFECTSVSSTSYGIVNKYKGSRNVIHCDFYRYKPDEEFYETEIFPLLEDHYLLVLEWAVSEKKSVTKPIITKSTFHFTMMFKEDLFLNQFKSDNVITCKKTS